MQGCPGWWWELGWRQLDPMQIWHSQSNKLPRTLGTGVGMMKTTVKGELILNVVKLKCQPKGFGHLESIGKPQKVSAVVCCGVGSGGRKCDTYNRYFVMTHLTMMGDRSEWRG